jgi:hypothetical protein
MLIRIETFFKLYVLKPNPILSTSKSIKDQRTTINLPKCSPIDSLEKFPIPKMHRGLMIEDMFFADRMIVSTFLYFPDPNKVHRSSAIGDFFTSFVNVYPSRILPMPKGIDYFLKIRANKLCKPTSLSAYVKGDWLFMTVVTVWSLYLLEFFRCRT